MANRIKQRLNAGKNKLKYNFAHMLELPKEVILDLPKITLVGTLQLQLENHRGIIEFSEEQVRINTKEGVLVITGEQFFLRNITEQEIVLDGKIKALSYQK